MQMNSQRSIYLNVNSTLQVAQRPATLQSPLRLHHVASAARMGLAKLTSLGSWAASRSAPHVTQHAPDVNFMPNGG